MCGLTIAPLTVPVDAAQRTPARGVPCLQVWHGGVPTSKKSRRLRFATPTAGEGLRETAALRKERPSGVHCLRTALLMSEAWERSASPTAGTRKPLYAYLCSYLCIFRPGEIECSRAAEPVKAPLALLGACSGLDGTCRAPARFYTWPENAGVLRFHGGVANCYCMSAC